ncbi:MAG: chromosomal replication initiator protein DnaA [Actinomycetota bacterium]|nr:chromosomal replication initiator protein DnaA [Actinomycetota bacterium]
MQERPPQELSAIWSGVREDLRGTLPPSAFENWLEPLRPVGVQGSRLYVSGPERVRGWFERRYGVAATEALRRRAPEFTEIMFTDAAPQPSSPSTRSDDREAIPAGLRRGLDFDRFVIGSGNRFAHSAALAVAESPGESYNPLFLYGAPGLGKTHLLVSIANYLRRQRHDLPVAYTTAERFTSEFVGSLRGSDIGPTQRFKERYREVGALLIDDVQFLEGKPRTEDEFFHTFNELISAGSQIVLSSDRPPEAMERLSERMRDRFAWGLTVEIQSPDLPTRIALLRRLATEHAIPASDVDVLRQIALAAPENLRRLEGALTRVMAFASLLGEAPTVDLVRKALGNSADEADPTGQGEPRADADEQLESIKRAVCDVLHVAPADMTSRRRTATAVRGRQLAMFVARNHTDLSLAEIARGFSRDHSTVIYAIRNVERNVEPGSDTHRTLERIHERLQIHPSTG